MTMATLNTRLRDIRARHSSSLLLLIAIAAAIIVGLLAMHSFRNHIGHIEPAGHEHHANSAAVHGDGSASYGAAQPVAAEECSDCGEHTSMIVMTCILAVLAVTLLALRPHQGLLRGAALRRAGPAPAARTAAPAIAPSLIALCISRT